MTTFDVRVDLETTEIQYNNFHVIRNGGPDSVDSGFINIVQKKDGDFIYRIAKDDINNYIKALQKAKELWG